MIFYTGSYTQEGAPAANPIGKGISCFNFDESTGSIDLLHHIPQRSPSYLAISDDGNYLYAVEEMFKDLAPEAYAYKIEKSGNLTLINSQPIKGDYTCHLVVCGDKLILANYMSGNALSYPIFEDGSLGKSNQTIQHSGVGLNKERQEAPHVHMVQVVNESQFFLVDLGLDSAKAYYYSMQENQWKANQELDLFIEPGSGARHMVLNKMKTHAYILGELSGDIHVLKLDEKINKTIQKISILPNDYNGEFGGAALRMHPNEKLLYASCRGSDTISAFTIDSESHTLSLITHYPALGNTPRDFNIHPNGEWLLVANQDSGDIQVFTLDKNTGELKYQNKMIVETPVNICWLE